MAPKYISQPFTSCSAGFSTLRIGKELELEAEELWKPANKMGNVWDFPLKKNLLKPSKNGYYKSNPLQCHGNQIGF